MTPFPTIDTATGCSAALTNLRRGASMEFMDWAYGVRFPRPRQATINFLTDRMAQFDASYGDPGDEDTTMETA